MLQPMNPDPSQVPPPPPAPPAQAYTPGTALYAPLPDLAHTAEPHPGQTVGQAPGTASGNFFGALFDMSFTKYITITWAKVIYILWLIGVGLTWLFGSYGFGSISGANTYRGEFDGAAFLFALIVGIVPALLQVIAGRMLLEFVVAIIRTEMNTRALVERR
ncbi:DUF4282 domain-containing protein [Actinomyces bowdenii]|uniref:DUF4282 domain-containing protein n=1 Tax=Actinomyces bowdenii TaxID=131109 RepID=UPI00214B4009|nr:DUF4282 domain-containing protein [Actinomyces bowdenii]MCR2052124.1 DUF4282 domain-containing protein [Actinomyces bowdenii]